VRHAAVAATISAAVGVSVASRPAPTKGMAADLDLIASAQARPDCPVQSASVTSSAAITPQLHSCSTDTALPTSLDIAVASKFPASPLASHIAKKEPASDQALTELHSEQIVVATINSHKHAPRRLLPEPAWDCDSDEPTDSANEPSPPAVELAVPEITPQATSLIR
jgi:hypothetical protein